MESNKDTRSGVVDVMRVFLAIVVVGIHARIFNGGGGYPFCRLAVPLFFVMSSYFLFKKIFMGQRSANIIIKEFGRRNICLYYFYVLILLPYFLYVYRDKWFGCGMAGVFDLVKRVPLVGVQTYWFIVAGIFSVCIGYMILNWLGEKTLMFAAISTYLFSVVSSSHFYILETWKSLGNVYSCFDAVYERPEFTFLGAMIWVWLGYGIAKREDRQGNGMYNHSWRHWFLLLISLSVLCLEWWYVKRKAGVETCDLYLSLPCAVYFVFITILHLRVSIANPRKLRDFSVALYMCHAPVIAILVFTFKRFGLNGYGLHTFAVSILICFVLFTAIERLRKSGKWHLLNYTW